MADAKRRNRAGLTTEKRAGESAASRTNKRPASPPIPRTPLRTVEHVRVQMARLFREAKAGRLPTGDASRLCYLLSQLRVTIESSSLEGRLQSAESTINELLARLGDHGRR